jgi:hypothetical protein
MGSIGAEMLAYSQSPRAANGFNGSDEMRDRGARKMTPAQIAEAQKLARECERKKYKGC